MPFDVGQNVAQRLIHPFNHGGEHGFRIIEASIAILMGEPGIDGKRDMHGLMGHVEEERLAVRDRLIISFVGFDRQSVRQENVSAVETLQVGHVPNAIGVPPFRAEILLSREAAGTTRRVASDVDIEADVTWIASGRPNRSEVGLPNMDRAVIDCLQERWESFCVNSTFDARLGTEAINISLWEIEFRVSSIVADIFF